VCRELNFISNLWPPYAAAFLLFRTPLHESPYEKLMLEHLRRNRAAAAPVE
jgi:hypothetical protein